MSENVHELELRYHDIFYQSLLSAPLVIQSFFVISGFLLTYKMQRISEKQSISWGMVPKEIFNRYIRLTPVYALVILLLATWYKFIGTRPLLEVSGQEEMFDCKEHWWIHLLYMNNYVYNIKCMPPSWYLAADMQLFCCALILYVLLQNNTYKNTILISLIVVGGAIAGVHTYVRDLNFNLFCMPSAVRELFVEDRTFNEIYKAGHGNISSYAIGMYLGYFVYRWQHKEIDNRKYWLFNYICRLVFPLLILTLMSGAIFYRDGPRAPLYMRVLFSVFVKPIFGILTAILIVGMIFKFENVFRKIFELDFWIIPSRLCYCVYLIHFPYIMIYIDMQTSLLQMTVYNIVALSIYITIASLVTAIPMFLLIEAPFIELSKHLTESPKKRAVIGSKYHKKTE